jgi:hypothetical protein
MTEKLMIIIYCSVCGTDKEVEFGELPDVMGGNISLILKNKITKFYVCSKECAAKLLEYYKQFQINSIDKRIEETKNGFEPTEIDKLLDNLESHLFLAPGYSETSIRNKKLKEIYEYLKIYRVKEKEKLNDGRN